MGHGNEVMDLVPASGMVYLFTRMTQLVGIKQKQQNYYYQKQHKMPPFLHN